MDILSLQSLLDWISLHPTWAGITIFLVALTESLAIVGLFMPGVIMMFGFGTLIATGNLEFWPTLWWAVAGAIAGDGISFWLGAHYKDGLRKVWPFSSYPGLLARGERFFNRHGGKSILFGRFVGPIRPVIPATAGMLGMPALQFLGINIISALAWAPAYLLPGIVFGTSLGLAAEVASRLAIMLVGIFISLLFNIWLIKQIYRFFAPRATHLANNILLWGRRHKRFGRITAALVDPHHPEIRGLGILAFSLIILAWIIVTIFQQFSVGPLLARLDSSSYHLIQSLRTPLADHVMVVISQLGDGIVHSAIIASLTIWLLWKKHWLAASHWLAAAAFAGGATWILKQSLQLPRPTNMFDGAMVYSFPSFHSTMASCLFGLLAVIIAKEVMPEKRWRSYVIASVVILSIALSRLYLGSHWLSDVVGGLLLGLAWAAILGIAYRRHIAAPIRLSGLIGIPVIVMLGFGGWHAGTTHTDSLQRYTIQKDTSLTSMADWQTNGWASFPAFRIDSRGLEMQPLNLQWAGPLDELKQHLLELGWQPSKPLSFANALYWFKPDAALAELPPLPHTHDGHYPDLSLELPGQQLILRLWPTNTALGQSGNRIWLGYIGKQASKKLPLMSIPTLASDFNTPIQQFKPFVAMLNWQIKYRDIGQPWHGEVIIAWSATAPADRP